VGGATMAVLVISS